MPSYSFLGFQSVSIKKTGKFAHQPELFKRDKAYISNPFRAFKKDTKDPYILGAFCICERSPCFLGNIFIVEGASAFSSSQVASALTTLSLTSGCEANSL